MTNRYHNMNFRRAAIFAASCLVMSSCTWEEFPEMLPEQQKPVDLSFTTAVNKTPKPDTRVIQPGTDFGGATSFPVSATPYPIGMVLNNPNGSEVFEGSGNIKAEMTVNAKKPDGTDIATWRYFDGKGSEIIPRGFPGAYIRLTAYHPWNADALADSIPFDFTRKVNIDTGTGQAQANLLLCNTRSIRIPADPNNEPIPLGFRNAYSKIVLKITKKEDMNETQNAGRVTETAIDNLTSFWVKNRGGIDPATGYVKPTSQPGRIWNDSIATLDINTPVEFTFLVPAFMDKDVRDDQFGFILEIDGQQRIFPLKLSQLNIGKDTSDTNIATYGFQQNTINTYNLVYNNSLLFLSLQSWNSVNANANFGETAEKNPTFEINLAYLGIYDIAIPKNQEAYLDYPKDQTQNPYNNMSRFYYINTHLNNTYLSSVLLGGNGPTIQESQAGQLYDIEKPYVRLQVTAIDVGGRAVVWQDENGGLIAKDVCRNYRGNSKSDWRLPRVSEMKVIMMWALQISGNNVSKFLGNPYKNEIKIDEAVPYWTATEAYMGIAGKVDDQETAWYVQGYYDRARPSLRQGNYKILTRNKQDAAFIRCVREM